MAIISDHTKTTNGSFPTSSTGTATKPSTTQDGDTLLVAFAFIGGVAVTGVPSGWTLLQTANAGSNKAVLKVYWKIANGEPASWDWTFDNPYVYGVTCLRITNTHASTPIETSSADIVNNNASPSFGGGAITPTVANSLILFFVAVGDGFGNNSNYAIAVSNPSWTELFDINNGGALEFSLAYATRPEVTATGNPSLTVFGAAADTAMVMVALPPKETFSISDTVNTSDSIATFLRGRKITASDGVTLTDLIVSAIARVFNFASKNSNSWDFRDKSD